MSEGGPDRRVAEPTTRSRRGTPAGHFCIYSKPRSRGSVAEGGTRRMVTASNPLGEKKLWICLDRFTVSVGLAPRRFANARVAITRVVHVRVKRCSFPQYALRPYCSRGTHPMSVLSFPDRIWNGSIRTHSAAAASSGRRHHPEQGCAQTSAMSISSWTGRSQSSQVNGWAPVYRSLELSA